MPHRLNSRWVWASGRRMIAFALVGSAAAIVGDLSGRHAAGLLAGWSGSSEGKRHVAPLNVAFVVEATPESAAELRGLADGIGGFREELARSGGDAQFGLVIAAGNALPSAATFDGKPFTGDAVAFRRRLEEAGHKIGQPGITAGIDSAVNLLGAAEGRRSLVVVARSTSADELSQISERLRSAGITGISLAVSKECGTVAESLRRGFPGATVLLEEGSSGRSHFELAVPALAEGLARSSGSWRPGGEWLARIFSAMLSAAGLALMTAVGLLAVRWLLDDTAIGWHRWALTPIAAGTIGAALSAADVCLGSAAPQWRLFSAATLGGGLAGLVSAWGSWQRAGLVVAIAAALTALASWLASMAWPGAGWPVSALTLGLPVGLGMASVRTMALLKITLPDGRTVVASLGRTFSVADLPGLTAARGHGPVAEVVANPTRPGVIGLKNLSRQPWTLTTPEGRRAVVPLTKTAELKSGTRIDFGRVHVEIA